MTFPLPGFNLALLNKTLCKHRYLLPLVHPHTLTHTQRANRPSPTRWANRPLHEYQYKMYRATCCTRYKGHLQGKRSETQLPWSPWLHTQQTKWSNTTLLTLHSTETSTRAANTPATCSPFSFKRKSPSDSVKVRFCPSSNRTLDCVSPLAVHIHTAVAARCLSYSTFTSGGPSSGLFSLIGRCPWVTAGQHNCNTALSCSPASNPAE